MNSLQTSIETTHTITNHCKPELKLTLNYQVTVSVSLSFQFPKTCLMSKVDWEISIGCSLINRQGKNELWPSSIFSIVSEVPYKTTKRKIRHSYGLKEKFDILWNTLIRLLAES